MSGTHSSITPPSQQPPATPVELAAEDFIAEFKRWRDVRGFSQKRLAREMGYDASYVSKIESGHQNPTRDFARRADEILHAGGGLIRRWSAFTTARVKAGGAAAAATLPPPGDEAHLPTPASLIVRHEQADLRYADGAYHAHIRRQLYNASDTPVTRYLIRIAVDRHPGKAEQSNELYRWQPLTWEELKLRAHAGEDAMAWQVKHDRDAFKEIWLLFENQHGKFPLYPGETAWIDYSYSVGAHKWGQWFQRAIRLPTERLSVRIELPAALEPALWGTQTTMTAEAVPLPSAIRQHDRGEQRVFEWTTENPPLHARFRLEWRFRAADTGIDETARPSERMRRLGVVQEGDPILRRPAEPFDLPRERDVAAGLGELLIAYLGPIRAAHVFGKGNGLAGPQIGIARAAAVVQLPDSEPLVLYNPRVVESSDDTDEQYEGCLSFFDIRGLVQRPLRIDVEHQTLDGAIRFITFQRDAARLWAHEIDHLAGTLYLDRMRPDIAPVPVEHYKGTGERWHY
jgi:peptide deformylase